MARKLASIQFWLGRGEVLLSGGSSSILILFDPPLHHPYSPSYSTTILSEPSERLRATSLGTMTIL